jgi:hypothetical protein
MLACVSRWRETNFNMFRNWIISKSTKVCDCHILFSSVKYCVIIINLEPAPNKSPCISSGIVNLYFKVDKI